MSAAADPMVTAAHRAHAHQLLSSIPGWPDQVQGRRHAHFAVAERVLALTLAVEEQRQAEETVVRRAACLQPEVTPFIPMPRRPPQFSGKAAAAGEHPDL